MSTHPNAILLCTLTPEGLARATMRAILASDPPDYDEKLKIGSHRYHCKVLESDYNDGWQIGGKEGDLLFFDLVTYGYGEQVAWDFLQAQKEELEAWAKDVCARHNCSYKISVTANYW